MNPSSPKSGGGGAKPSIRAARNGPFLVHDLADLRNSRGESLPTQPVVALCRCGTSKNKPFCDGSHKGVGFTGVRETDGSKNKLDDYAGKQIVVHDNRGVCAHAAACVEGLQAVFRMRQKPWIDPDGAPVAEVIATIQNCPSGALSYTLSSVTHDGLDRAPSITVSKDGPYHVVGGIELEDEQNGQVSQSREHFTLCRCGISKNKPFCDGSHARVGFRDEDPP